METLPNGLAWGGQLDYFGLYLSASFHQGHSKGHPRSITFDNPRLSRICGWCDPSPQPQPLVLSFSPLFLLPLSFFFSFFLATVCMSYPLCLSVTLFQHLYCVISSHSLSFSLCLVVVFFGHTLLNSSLSGQPEFTVDTVEVRCPFSKKCDNKQFHCLRLASCKLKSVAAAVFLVPHLLFVPPTRSIE